jgi:hypothetical protein
MLSQLSFWPWIIGVGVSVAAMVITAKRTVGETYISPSLALFGSGAVAVIVCGLIEASMTGIFVGRPIGDVLDATLGLGLTSGISSFVAVFTSYPILKGLGKVR